MNFMVRVQNQPVNPGVLVATLAACSRAQHSGAIFLQRANEQKAASTQVRLSPRIQERGTTLPGRCVTPAASVHAAAETRPSPRSLPADARSALPAPATARSRPAPALQAPTRPPSRRCAFFLPPISDRFA